MLLAVLLCGKPRCTIVPAFWHLAAVVLEAKQVFVGPCYGSHMSTLCTWCTPDY
jgi:hypothetical protein